MGVDSREKVLERGDSDTPRLGIEQQSEEKFARDDKQLAEGEGLALDFEKLDRQPSRRHQSALSRMDLVPRVAHAPAIWAK
jgi:hypothetical protein